MSAWYSLSLGIAMIATAIAVLVYLKRWQARNALAGYDDSIRAYGITSATAVVLTMLLVIGLGLTLAGIIGTV